MRQITGTAFFSELQWPADALGRRALLAFEPYEPDVLSRPGHPATDEGIIASGVERGFEFLRQEAWSFPAVAGHQVVISHDLDDFAVIDDYADELFAVERVTGRVARSYRARACLPRRHRVGPRACEGRP